MILFSTYNSERGWQSRLSLALAMWKIRSDHPFSLSLYPLTHLSSEAPWEQAQPAEQQVKSRRCRHLAIRLTSCLSWTHLWNKPLTSCYDPDNHCLIKLQVLVLCLGLSIWVVLNGWGTHWVSPSPRFDISQLSLLSHFVRFTKSSNFVYCSKEPS